MANLCNTTYKVTGTEKAVKDLWNTLQSMNVNTKDIWLDELAVHYGIDYEERFRRNSGENFTRVSSTD